MYAFLIESRPLSEDRYEFFTYQGKKPIQVEYRGAPISIEKGTRFGVRPSTNGKFIRLIFPDQPTRVLTIDHNTAKNLARGV